MDDKTISSPDMTEYKFNESDGVPADAATDSGSATPYSGGEASVPASSASGFNLKNINLQKFKVPIAISLAISIMYGVFNFYNAKKTHAAEQKKLQAQEVATQQMPIIAPPVREVIVQPQPSSDQIEQVQASVQRKIDAAAQEMASNRDQFLGLRDAVSKAQQDISSVSQNVGQLTVATQQLLSEVQQLKSPPKVKSKKKATKPLAIYHIRAIVPGRVWLESADGKSATLRVGDSLEGYGTVEVISPQQGMVLMSDGSYIQYGVNDF
ncbi:intracellular multiplication protein IcmG [Gammaproteobacteria bacterium]